MKRSPQNSHDKRQSKLKQIKHGGNGDIRIFLDGTAVKTLKVNTSSEKRKRFRLEMTVLRELSKSGLANIVKILCVNDDKNPASIYMKAYPGNSNDLLGKTRGCVADSARLLLPIVRTLEHLARSTKPIYHRDLKPDNLLYQIGANGAELVVADFGCAYFNTDDENRLTQDWRAVGAMAYRAPEYQYGRVEDVTEKGDIFSLGKLLWYFINGTENDVFPYTLWFPNEYNLKHRFPGVPKIDEANLVIADAVHHDPHKRSSYPKLIEELERLTTSTELTSNIALKARLLEQEKLDELRRSEVEKFTAGLISIFYEELVTTLESLHRTYGTLELLKMQEVQRLPAETIASRLANMASGNHSVWFYSGARLTVNAVANVGNTGSFRVFNVQTTLPYLEMSFDIQGGRVLTYHYVKSDEFGLVRIVDGLRQDGEEAGLHNAFVVVLERLVSYNE